MLASDIPAVLQKTRKVLPIDENQVVEVRADGVRVTDLEGRDVDVEPFEVEWDVARAQKGGFADFMLKEIHEQPSAIRGTRWSVASATTACWRWTSCTPIPMSSAR